MPGKPSTGSSPGYGSDSPFRVLKDAMSRSSSASGRLTLMTILVGQLVSVIGTGLTDFAIGVWVFQRTGSVTNFSLTMLAITLPATLISPVAGAVVDRWNHRWTMIVGDWVAALSSAALAAVLYFKIANLWTIIALVGVGAVVSVPHEIAYTAAVALLVSKQHLGRAIGAMQAGLALARVLSPALAAFCLSLMPVYSVLLLDVASFAFALITLFMVRIPNPNPSAEGQAAKGSLLREAFSGWSYIRTRQGLLWLLLLVMISSFVVSVSKVVLIPLLLTIAPVRVVGAIVSFSAVGMLTGSVVLSIWGGPRRRISGVLVFGLLFGLSMILFGVSASPWLVGIAGFGFLFSLPMMDGCSQMIWLTKTPADLQGRVLAVKQMAGWCLAPLAYVIAGPLVDRIFEPAMSGSGFLAHSIGAVIGTGHGRGMALMMIVLGILFLLATLASWSNPLIRHLETNIPDFPGYSEAIAK